MQTILGANVGHSETTCTYPVVRIGEVIKIEKRKDQF